ncbi:hypothetical protein C7T94_04125 [Pedobacter yulinensis]|uniref:Uncharacterized protein n=1 Tax=Pedobacter yulinensis TaxID=2126353 RepID=A0A2T3HNA3_9SPHI|nr:hypothetical protein C7T94_04125 [Pedobacter yulinensis]
MKVRKTHFRNACAGPAVSEVLEDSQLNKMNKTDIPDRLILNNQYLSGKRHFLYMHVMNDSSCPDPGDVGINFFLVVAGNFRSFCKLVVINPIPYVYHNYRSQLER